MVKHISKSQRREQLKYIKSSLYFKTCFYLIICFAKKTHTKKFDSHRTRKNVIIIVQKMKL
jgi:hypothetical protein